MPSHQVEPILGVEERKLESVVEHRPVSQIVVTSHAALGGDCRIVRAMCVTCQ